MLSDIFSSVPAQERQKLLHVSQTMRSPCDGIVQIIRSIRPALCYWQSSMLALLAGGRRACGHVGICGGCFRQLGQSAAGEPLGCAGILECIEVSTLHAAGSSRAQVRSVFNMNSRRWRGMRCGCGAPSASKRTSSRWTRSTSRESSDGCGEPSSALLTSVLVKYFGMHPLRGA